MSETDVVFTFSLEVLEDAVAREFCRPPDQSLLALARDERVGRLLVADPWRSLPISMARRRPYRLHEPIEVGGRAAVRVRPHRLRRTESVRLATVERAYRRYAERLGQALATSRGERNARPESAALVTFHPFVAAYCEAPWIRNVVFVARDDWTTGAAERPWWDLHRQAYRQIDDRKAAMFAVSAELAARISPRVTVVPNGVDKALWTPPRPEPVRIADLPRPRAIYAGTLDDRLDRELVEATARAVGSVVLIGWVPDPAEMSWLGSIPNLHVIEPVGQIELAAVMQACDVGLLPHRDTPIIRAMSPLKLYEYLAAGLPVAAVDLPPVRDIDDRVLISTGREDWNDVLRRALGAGRATEERRLRFVDGASWASRTRPIVEAAVTGHA